MYSMRWAYSNRHWIKHDGMGCEENVVAGDLQEATSNRCHASSNRCLTSSNKKLLETSALLLVTIKGKKAMTNWV